MKSMTRFVWVLVCIGAGCGDDDLAADGGTGGMDARPSPFDAGDRADVPATGCTAASQCPEASTEPARCAEASCEAGRCVYRALDRDGDGFGEEGIHGHPPGADLRRVRARQRGTMAG